MTAFLILFTFPALVAAQIEQPRVAVIDANEKANRLTTEFNDSLAAHKNLKLLDADLSAAVFRAVKLENPFNLSLDEARNLGAAIGGDFLMFMRNDVGRRSSFQRDVYFEAFAVIFLVSARTGELIAWENPIFAAGEENAANKSLFAEIDRIAARFAKKISAAHELEKTARIAAVNAEIVSIEDLPDAENVRIPLPYKRFVPAYTAAASRLSVEATVDVSVELDERGTTTEIEVTRWAGFDLDEAAIANVKKMQFRPALRDGKPFAVRVLLRYNFRDARNNEQ